MKYFTLIFLLCFFSCKNNVSSDAVQNVVNQEPVSDCKATDIQAPVFTGEIELIESASQKSSPRFSFAKANDNCEMDHYEVSIGSSPGLSDIQPYISMQDKTEGILTGLSLSYTQSYYLNVKAVDAVGNESGAISSHSFKVFSPKALTGLVLWLDSFKLSSLIDNNDIPGNEQSFTGDIKEWQDISESSNPHNFVKEGHHFPELDYITGGVRFNGANELMATLDHSDINTSIVAKRTVVVNFKTGANTSNRQVIFEEGGSVRGLNIYLENNEIHCGFWNIRNDGDGAQPFIGISGAVQTQTNYSVIFTFDYNNAGEINCYLNGHLLAQAQSQSRLHPHSGDIGLGAMNDGSYFADGANSNRNPDFHFEGVIYELLLYNEVHPVELRNKLNSNLLNKWGH